MQYMIDHWHHNNSLSCLSVCNAMHCGAQGGCRGLKVVFLVGNFRFTSSHFCRRLYRLATNHTKKTNRQQFGKLASLRITVEVQSQCQVGSEAISYVASSTIGLLSLSYALFITTVLIIFVMLYHVYISVADRALA